VARVVLASGSPRRLELLSLLGIAPEVVRPDIDETPLPGERAEAYVRRLATAKAAVVDDATALVVAADTTVELDGRLLGKPVDVADAVAMLRSLSARTHRVHTGVAVVHGDRSASAVATTAVAMAPITAELAAWYVATGEPLDKAGAYAVQGVGAALVEEVRGSVTNVVGLPLTLLVALAHDVGVDLVPASAVAD
jgi:septum formation protein